MRSLSYKYIDDYGINMDGMKNTIEPPKILLACSNEGYRNDLTKILKDYQIENRVEQTDMIRQDIPPLLILTDRRELDTSGTPAETPALFLCRREELETSSGPLPEQFRDILLAPFIPSVVLRRVESCIRETRLRRLWDLIPCHVFVKNRKGQFLEANKSFADSLGLESADIIGVYQTAVQPEKRETEIASLDDQTLFTPGEKSYSLQERYRDSRGNIRWMQTIKLPCSREMYGEDALIVSALEITQQKKNEEELKEDRDRLQNILKSISQGIIVTDEGTHIYEMNPAAENLTGWKREDAAGELFDTVFQMINPETGTPRKTLDGVSMDKVSELRDQTVLRSRSGKEHRIAGTSSPIRTMEGKVYGTVTIFRNIGTGNAAEQELPAKEKLDTTRELIGRIAREFGELLGDLPSSENGRTGESVELIRKSFRQAASLTEKLLTFSGKKANETVSADPRNTIEAVIADLQEEADKRILLKISSEEGGITVTADPAALQDALFQVGRNALQSMPEGGTLEIASGNRELDAYYCKSSLFDLAPGPYAALSVRDTGSGISPEILPRIFDPFFTTRPQGMGIGLGLTNVYSAVIRMKGAIEVASEQDKGTTVTILLPEEAAKEQVKKQKEEDLSSGKGSILVVDDEPILRKVLSEVLEKEGLTVITAEDGKKGLFQFKKHPDMFDLIIMDMIMPDMTGIESYDAIKSINPDMKVLFTSGYFRNKNLKEITESETTGFLEKPFNRETFLKRVREMLERT